MQDRIDIIYGLILVGSLILVAFTSTLVYFEMESEKKCNTRVELLDGTIYECRYARSSNNGLTDIKMCGGIRVKIPTARIKTILN